MVDADNSIYEIEKSAGSNKKVVVVANSAWVPKSIYLSIGIEGVHLPFEVAEEIALDILARLRDRGFYD